MEEYLNLINEEIEALDAINILVLFGEVGLKDEKTSSLDRILLEKALSKLDEINKKGEDIIIRVQKN